MAASAVCKFCGRDALLGASVADMQPSCWLQVSVSGQALVFVVRTSGWSLTSRAGLFTYIAFFAAQASLHIWQSVLSLSTSCTCLLACSGASMQAGLSSAQP